MAVADFNGDGQPDIAVANAGSGTVGVLTNAGGGTFGAQVTYQAGTTPLAVAVGDFNGDGRPDLGVVNNGDGTVSVLMSQAVGGFLRQVVYVVGASPDALAVGDFDGDGHPDLAVTNRADSTVSVLLNQGDGTFATQVTYAVGLAPNGVAVGDFNGDGKLDLAVTNGGSEVGDAGTGASVLLNQGGGTFAAAVLYSAAFDPDSLAVGDFNGDSRTDLAVGSSFVSIGSLSVFMNRGSGTFAPAVAYDAADAQLGGLPSSLAAGDFNGDGWLDIAAGNQAPNATDSTVGIFLNQGIGTFAPETFYTAGYGPNSLAAADLDGNGSLDLVVADEWANDVSVLLNGCPAPVSGAQLLCTPSPINFGTVPSGSVSMAVTCTNTGNETLVVDGVGTYDTVSAFAVSGLPSLPATLGPLQDFPFTVTYSGGAAGGFDELVIDWVTENPPGPGEVYTDPLSATPSGTCALSIAPASVNFGSVAPGTTAQQVISLSSVGGGLCDISNVALGSGTDPFFALVAGQATSYQIAPNATAQIGVSFSPTSAAPPLTRTGTVTFSSNAPANPVVPLSATIQ
ncbi:MAG TPA: FG-GAP-like repeat-containing protein [Myxococcales bacterium]|nr:FG-GAP-like repeat-containing protein [Myxococcales bacterium]